MTSFSSSIGISLSMYFRTLRLSSIRRFTTSNVLSLSIVFC